MLVFWPANNGSALAMPPVATRAAARARGFQWFFMTISMGCDGPNPRPPRITADCRNATGPNRALRPEPLRRGAGEFLELADQMRLVDIAAGGGKVGAAAHLASRQHGGGAAEARDAGQHLRAD